MASLNIYEREFSAKCPVNGRVVNYKFVLETINTVMVEDILAACNVAETLHEPLAEELYVKFGGKQTLTAHHHGVTVTTIRF